MENIILALIQDAYICGGEYRLHTDDGKPSACVLHNYYTATAIDADGNNYAVYWEISNDYNPAENDESSACDWDSPVEIITDAGEIVTDRTKIRW